MLHNHRRVGYQGPEIVRAQFRIALKVVEEGLGIGVVVRISTMVSTGDGRHNKKHTWLPNP
jgi:hypothetical protein